MYKDTIGDFSFVANWIQWYCIIYFSIVAGLYDLNAKGHRDALDVIDLIWDVIAEARESDFRLYLSTLLVYVNMCDIDGEVKRDCYV